MIEDIINKDFWRATLIRAIKTICQTAVATIGTTTMIGDVNWALVLSASALAGILSILTSISAGLPEVKYQQSLEQLAELREEPLTDEEDEDEEEGDEDGVADD